MAKISKEQQWRMEGFSYAISKLEEGRTLEDLKKEARVRGAYGIPINLSKTEIDKFGEKVKEHVIRTILLMSCNVLQDEFDFGKKRIGRFMDRFNRKTGAMKYGFVSWMDIANSLQKELGIEVELLE